MAHGVYGALEHDGELLRFVLPRTLPTGKQIGRGTYGSVEEVSVDGLICVGKRFDENLFKDISATELSSKFVKECKSLCSLHHPNITQFLGVCLNNTVPQSPLLLVFEKLEGGVKSLLESVPNVPIILKHSLLEDTARGLHYLHTLNPIILHGDLTGNNVLYTSSLVAKIADVSNYQLFDIPSHSEDPEQSQSLSDNRCLYMPPEISRRSSSKTDIFSFGHLALCILTQVFPKSLPDPSSTTNHHQLQSRHNSEVERRDVYFQKAEKELASIDNTCLLTIVKKCLHYSPQHRPTSKEVLTALQGMNVCSGDAVKLKTNAVRQVITAKDFASLEQQLKNCEEAHRKTLEELECKDRVIQEIGAKLRQKDTALQQPTTSSGNETQRLEVTEKVKAENSKDMELKVLCGYYANPREESTTKGYTHDWKAFVKGSGKNDSDIRHVVKKVVFQLHKDYEPNAKRVCEQPPYEVSVSGNGTFDLPIKIHFTNKEVATFKYPVNLYKDCDVSTVLGKTFSFKNPNKEFRANLLLAGGCSRKPKSADTKQKQRKRALSKSKSTQPGSKKKKMSQRSVDSVKKEKDSVIMSTSSDSSDNEWTISQEIHTSESD